MIEKIKKDLYKYKDDNYKMFSSSLLPETSNILGVRLPILRKISKQIIKSDYNEFILKNDNEYMELTLIHAMVIGLIDDEFSNILKYIENFIPKISNWSVCDTLCCGLKIINKNKVKTKKFLEKYFLSDKEFELRFCFVILLNYFADDIDYVLDKISKFDNPKYYAKMGVAWCLSYCFMWDFDKTIDFIKNKKIDNWVLRKGIRKAVESYRIDDNKKCYLKLLLTQL